VPAEACVGERRQPHLHHPHACRSEPPACCPNDAVRAAQHTSYLPDCRGIELVNSPDKGVQNAEVVNQTRVGLPSFSPRGAQVTLEYNGSGTVTAYVKIGGAASCPAPQVEVQAFSAGARPKEPFYIALYR